MRSYAKSCIAVTVVAALFSFAVNAAPKDESPKSGIVKWEYKVMDLAVIPYPVILLNPKASPSDLEEGERQVRIHSDLNTEWPQSIPDKSVDEFERRLVELGAAGWELVMKDRNMVVFKRPKR